MTDTTEYEYTLFYAGGNPNIYPQEDLYADPDTLETVRESLSIVATYDALQGSGLGNLLVIVRRPKGSQSYDDYEIYEDNHEDQGAEV